jgi:uncharacterized protein YdeI (YjbR/CyaY-like superfamily)
MLVTSFKKFDTLAFFEGTSLKDSHDILVAPEANSRAVYQVRFTNVQVIVALKPILKAYIHEALEVEKHGIRFIKIPKSTTSFLTTKKISNHSFKHLYTERNTYVDR